MPADRKPRVCFGPTAGGDAEGYSDRFLAAFGPDRANVVSSRVDASAFAVRRGATEAIEERLPARYLGVLE